jgi:hypothetical protein
MFLKLAPIFNTKKAANTASRQNLKRRHYEL